MKHLEKLEQKFNIANDLISELSELVEEIPTTTIQDCKELSSEIPVEVFSIETLKNDFILVRNSIIKLVSTGQRILDSASIIDVSDMKASQLQALSDLQTTLGNNLKMLISIYKDISDIETSRNKASVKSNDPVSSINTGSIVNNNILFSGNSAELLDLIKQNK